MAFGQELKDFVNGFTTGYKLIDSPEDREWKREERRMKKESFERTGRWHDEEMDYKRERDATEDERWNKSYDFRVRTDERDYNRNVGRDAVSDERENRRVYEDERNAEERRRLYNLKMREGTGGAVPDDVENFTPTGLPNDGNAQEGNDIHGALESSDWLRYSNSSATRNKPLSPKLETALAQIAPDLGVQIEVFSGGQPAKGLARIGSRRHDHGDAADIFVYKDGRKLDWANPKDRPIFEEIVKRGRAVGLTGFGAGPGYMQAGSMHVGYGAPAVWGAGGSSKNAPEWLRNAYSQNFARGGMVGAIPTDDEEPQEDAQSGLFTVEINDQPVEVAEALPTEGPVPTPRPSYEGVSSNASEADDAPTDDPYETARRAVREGMQRAIQQAQADVQTALDDPEVKKYEDRYIRGYGAAPSQVVRQMMDKIDPEKKMSPNQRTTLAMANTYRFFWERGEPEKAKEAAASLVQYYRQQSQQYLALAQAAAENGDVDSAAKAAMAAYANVPNGRDLSIDKNKDGSLTVNVTDAKTGKAITKQVIAPNEMLAAAMGFNPTTFDDEIMNAAGMDAAEYSDASLEDLGKVSEEIRGTIETDFEGSGLTKEGMAAIEDVATDIAKVKQNGVAPTQAVRMAAGMLDAGGELKAKPERGHPDLVRVEFDGQTVVMSKGQFNKIQSMRADKANRTSEKEAADKASSERTSKQLDDLWKGAAAFGSAIVAEPPAEVQDRNKERHENINKARSNFGAIPDSGEETVDEAVPAPQDTEASFNEERIQELLAARDNAIARAKASNKDPKQFGLDEINAALAELGYKEAAAK